MSTSNGNIFFNYESLAFSMPLFIVCGTYAYFKYVPMHIGLPALGGLFILYQIRSQIKSHQGQKLQNLDDKQMADIAAELEGDSSDPKDEQKTKAEKKKFAVQQRLAAERKKETKKSTRSKKAQAADDDDDDDDLLTFAKGARTDKKKN